MLLLDANILIRAVLGSKVLLLLRKYAEHADFLAPNTAFQEALEHLPMILAGRGIAIAPAVEVIRLVAGLVRVVGAETSIRRMKLLPESASAVAMRTTGPFLRPLLH